MLAINEVETNGKQSQEHQERIAEALDHILHSPRFKDSQQLQSLLRYVVDEAVKGNEDGLKERIIGIYVFGRRPDYDTTNDPIGRSRMGLLRKRLAQYYEGEDGEQASVKIVIPNGTYRPGFVFQPLTKEMRTKAALADTKASTLSVPAAAGAVATLHAPAPVVPLTDSSTVVPGPPRAKWVFKARAAAAVVVIVLLGAWCSLRCTSQSELDALWWSARLLLCQWS
jgi:hypothetical protein